MQHRGTYFSESGSRYDGEWQSNKPHGQGTLHFPSGDRYEGQFHNGAMHGNEQLDELQRSARVLL